MGSGVSPFVVICVVIVAIIVPSALLRCNVNRRGKRGPRNCVAVFSFTQKMTHLCVI